MLTEFALTPDLFDEQHHAGDPAWREKIRAFGRGLFPPSNPCPTIIADLFGGTWSYAVGQAIARADPRGADPSIIGLLQSLRSRLQRACVKRPARGDYPSDEAGWVRAACDFDGDAPIDRIVGTDAFSQDRAGAARLSTLSRTGTDEFWNGITGTHSPRMDLGAQMDLLRPICLHATFICFASPHVYGSGSSDFDFATELITRALARPADFPRVELLDIHTKGEPDPVARESHRDFVLHELRSRVGPPRPTVRLFFWPKLLERILLAGDVTIDAAGERAGKTRWALSLSHVARPVLDGPSADPTTWALLHDRDASRWHERLYGQPATAGREYPSDAPFPGSAYQMP